MSSKPVVFISATSDLRSARDLVGKVLYSMGYEPVWQEIAATDGGELLEVLRHRIEPCAMVVQLVGGRYGAEPPQPTEEFGRVSYTQFEALHAERLGRKVIYHVVSAGFPTDLAPAETEEVAQLQAQYKEKLVATNRLRQDNIGSPGDLELSIRRISDELAALRAKSERRARRTTWLVAAALAGVAAVAALVFVVLHQQNKSGTETQAQLTAIAEQQKAQQEQLAAYQKQLLATVAPKLLPQGETKPAPLPSELLEKAELLLEQGDAEQQALAQIALKRHDEANRIIQGLQARPGIPIDEAFRLLTLEGDNWYQAGEFDKALAPYEKAMALRPDDFDARNHFTLALDFARLGSIAEHQRRAIEVAEGTLKIVNPGSADWAITQNNLGIAWWRVPTGDKAENLRKAIGCYEAALTVYTKAADPTDWATTQDNLGVAWWNLPTGDLAENLRKAFACYEAALTVRTKAADPTGWATTQDNLGKAWYSLPTGDTAENLRKAIGCYEAVLTVSTKAADPAGWAATQNNLGIAWKNLPTGDTAENVRKAIDCYEAALTVYTKAADPTDWAMTQNNLGNAWSELPTGDKAENVRKAIDCYEAALTVYTKAAEPTDWAMTQYNLGLAWSGLPTGDRAENLRKAIASIRGALRIYTQESFPEDHEDAVKRLADLRTDYVALSAAKDKPFDSIAPAE